MLRLDFNDEEELKLRRIDYLRVWCAEQDHNRDDWGPMYEELRTHERELITLLLVKMDSLPWEDGS